jgi:hypothetical protein
MHAHMHVHTQKVSTNPNAHRFRQIDDREVGRELGPFEVALVLLDDVPLLVMHTHYWRTVPCIKARSRPEIGYQQLSR